MQTTETLETATELLKAAEGAKLLNLGSTRFAELEKEPDFPQPVWMGPRGKRYIKGELLSWALSQRKATDSTGKAR
jgi:predicted DNA-binding transcriptional regulator AlpA